MEKRVPEKAYAKKNAPSNHVSTRAKECVVTLHFSDMPNPNVRRKVADLLVIAFEKQIGVKEKT